MVSEEWDDGRVCGEECEECGMSPGRDLALTAPPHPKGAYSPPSLLTLSSLCQGHETWPVTVPAHSNIDLWWVVHDGGLLLLLSIILRKHRKWHNCNLRVYGAQRIRIRTRHHRPAALRRRRSAVYCCVLPPSAAALLSSAAALLSFAAVLLFFAAVLLSSAAALRARLLR